MDNTTNQFLKVQGEIMIQDVKIASLEDIIKLLKRGLAVLSELSKQCQKITHFF